MRRRTSVLLALAALAACGGGDGPTAPVVTDPQTTPPVVAPPATPSYVGTYDLQSMDGARVPAVYFVGEDFRFDVTAGSFALAADGTYRVALAMRFVGPQGITEQPEQEFETGTYTVSGAVVTLRSAAGVTMSASLAGGLLSMRMDGQAFVYRKR
jgi:hypothetical protein